MRALPAALTPELYREGSADAWLLLVQVDIDDVVSGWRLCRDTGYNAGSSLTTWPTTTGKPVPQGTQWVRFPFEIDQIGETRSGEMPMLNLVISNINRAAQYYVEQANGASDATVTFYVVHSAHLDQAPALTAQYSVIHSSCDAKEARFFLGDANLFRRRFPLHKIRKNICPWPFAGTICGASAAEPVLEVPLERIQAGSDTLIWIPDSYAGDLGSAGIVAGSVLQIVGSSVSVRNNTFKVLNVLSSVPGTLSGTGRKIQIQTDAPTAPDEYPSTARMNVHVCDKRLYTCRLHNNAARFRGFPGVGLRGLRT